ncbi:MAG: hypothetical protein B7Z15_09475 [Rhizobiales bacterium 32-66-8]|nr:MAG: hypothetical protein B7Z15_09475 [Rhizobiales bacterium 32-66-8]
MRIAFTTQAGVCKQLGFATALLLVHPQFAIGQAPLVGASVGATIGAPFRLSEPPVGTGRAPAYGPYHGPGPDGEITAAAIVEHLAERGFSRITGLKQKGDIFLCEATGPRRERVRLVLDARSGEISGMEVIGFENKRYEDTGE